ncbi:MAG: formate dehydrogenase accessory sulfurtransferase FdhD [Dehalococcoidales bacterium]|nr:formate dehydrogenase accessory sulfurtransferase FdhD [Dehalococcoidales bacterium]
MTNGAASFTVKRFSAGGVANLELEIAREFPLTVIFNGVELVTLLCSPVDMKCLAAGYLASEGLIERKEEIKRILLDEDKGIIRVDTLQPVPLVENATFKRVIASGCGRGASLYNTADVGIPKIESNMRIGADKITALVEKFQHHSDLYSATHGVHSAALCSADEIAVFFEDVGRHNAFDKIFGKCLLEGISLENNLVVTSGRMSSDSVYKVARRGMPVLVSVSSPTDLAVRIAADLGVTLAGRVTKQKVDVYTHTERVLGW